MRALVIQSFALVCLAFSVFAFFSFQLAGHGGERACTVYEGHVTFPGSTWSMFYLRKGCLAGSLPWRLCMSSSPKRAVHRRLVAFGISLT